MCDFCILLHIHIHIHILSYLALFTQTFLKSIIAIGKNSNPFNKIVYSRFLYFSKRWIIELFPTMTVYNGNPKNLVAVQSMKLWQIQVKERRAWFSHCSGSSHTSWRWNQGSGCQPQLGNRERWICARTLTTFSNLYSSGFLPRSDPPNSDN